MPRIKSNHVVSIAIFMLILGAYVSMAVWYPVAYIWATYEDLFGEWGQTWLFAFACMASVFSAIRCRSYRWFFVLLAIALFYTVMEEISWGQRIFDFESPDFFKRNNLQRETNLHNMLVGPFSTTMKDVIEYTLASALIIYGLVFPLSLRLNWRFARWLDKLGVASPPLYLWPFFVVAGWLETAPFHFNEAEIAEILVGFALCVTALQYWYADRRNVDPHLSSGWPADAGRGMSAAIVSVFVLTVVLAGLTTLWFYNAASNHIRIENRLLNGYEKFADRYDNYGRWDIVAGLYLRVHEAEPTRTSVLRRLANAYRQDGDEESFLFYTNKALDLSLATHARNPNKISTNMALSRTYRQLGEIRKSREHGQRAHELALERVEAEPESAHWAYWLGKTYRHLGDYDAAHDEFKRAFERNPASKKYRKAYYEMRNVTGK